MHGRGDGAQLERRMPCPRSLDAIREYGRTKSSESINLDHQRCSPDCTDCPAKGGAQLYRICIYALLCMETLSVHRFRVAMPARCFNVQCYIRLSTSRAREILMSSHATSFHRRLSTRTSGRIEAPSTAEQTRHAPHGSYLRVSMLFHQESDNQQTHCFMAAIDNVA